MPRPLLSWFSAAGAWALAAGATAAAPGVVGCGGGEPGPARPASTARRAGASAPTRCAATVDVAGLLARHARAYGSPEAVSAVLPVVIAGTSSVEGRSGKSEIVLTAKEHRTQAWVAGLFSASGIDARGAWTVQVGGGVVERLAGVEAIEPALTAWLLRRSYVTAFEPGRDAAKCEDATPSAPAGGARATLAFARPELGSPLLSFDVESGALLSVAHTHADGTTTLVTYEAWSEVTSVGVRWPRKGTEHPQVGSSVADEHSVPPPASTGPGRMACVRFDARGTALPEAGDACVAPPADRFTLHWPAGEKPRVRLPMTYLGGELIVRARIGGREVPAFLDSGANVTAVDATTPAGAAFRPIVELTGSGSTQKVRLGFGELEAIDLGELHAEHVPTVSVVIPALDAFGDKRPELILGYSFFATAVVRVDYKRSEIVLARTTEGLFVKGSEPRAVPLHVLGSKIVAEGAVEGAAASFEIDTGNGGGLDLHKKWAATHGLPGSRKVVELLGRYGAGAGETMGTFYRLGAASLGPITFDGSVTHVSDPPAPGTIAGLAGNDVLARCDAVVFDVARRTLWLEGACDRPVRERRMGWRLARKPDASVPDRPWVVSALWPGGAAERGGIQVGDRVLEVGGKPATSDVAPIWTMEEQPVGTKVPVVVARASASRTRVLVELRAAVP